MPKPKPSKPAKPSEPPRAYEAFIIARADVDTLRLSDVPAGFPVTLQIGETMKLTGKVSRHRASREDTSLIAFDLVGADQAAPLSSAEIRSWFADALAALVEDERTPSQVRELVNEFTLELGNLSGAFDPDPDHVRHVVSRALSSPKRGQNDDSE